MATRKYLFSAMLALLFPLMVLAAEEQADVNAAFKDLSTKLKSDVAPAEKVKMCQDFLAKFPDSQYTIQVLYQASDIFDELKQPADFVKLAEGVLVNVKTPRTQRVVKLLLVDAYAETGDRGKIKSLAADLTAGADTSFNTYQALLRALTKAALWTEVLDCLAKAEPLASAEGFKKEYPDRKLTEAELARRGQTRKAGLLTYSGWAKANTGKPAEALQDFTSADKLAVRSYLGFSNDELDLYWGKTLARENQNDAALERLARSALYKPDEAYREALKDAYVKKNGKEKGFPEYLKGLRLKYARQMEDFTLPTYGSDNLTFSTLKGKVVLLAFWFPT